MSAAVAAVMKPLEDVRECRGQCQGRGRGGDEVEDLRCKDQGCGRDGGDQPGPD